MPTPYGGREFMFSNPDGTRFRGARLRQPVRGRVRDPRRVHGGQGPAVGFYHYATRLRGRHAAGAHRPGGRRRRRVGARSPQARTAGAAGRPGGRPLRDPRDRRDPPVGAATARPQAAQPGSAAGPATRRPIEARLRATVDGRPGRAGRRARTSGCACSCASPTCPMRSPAPRSRSTATPPATPASETTARCATTSSAVSDGRLDYTNVVTEYFTAKHDRDHYTDPAVEHGIRAQQLIREGLKHLKAVGFDFEQLTADADGFVRALNVFYAGPDGQRLERGAVAALGCPCQAVRGLRHALVLGLPDHQHRVRADAANVLPRERPHDLRLPGPLRLRLRVQWSRRLLPDVRRRLGHESRPGVRLPEAPGRLGVEGHRGPPGRQRSSWPRGATTS